MSSNNHCLGKIWLQFKFNWNFITQRNVKKAKRSRPIISPKPVIMIKLSQKYGLYIPISTINGKMKERRRIFGDNNRH